MFQIKTKAKIMSKTEILEISPKSPLSILNAPKIKLKKALISPTPFSLNDSNTEEENDSYDDKSYDTFDDDDEVNDINRFQNDDKSNITSYTIKIKKTIKQ